MLPFPIITNTDIPPEPTYKKMITPAAFMDNTVLVLTFAGDLYGIGGNGSGIFGSGDTSAKTTWYKIYENVEDMWCSDNTGFLLIKTKSNDYFYAGSNAWTGAASPTNILTMTNCNSYFSPIGGVNSIRSITAGVAFMFVITTGDVLYAIGDNSPRQLGLGTAVNKVTVLTSTALTNVDRVCTHYGYATWVLKKDKTMWRCGRTDNGALATGVSPAVLPLFTQYVVANKEIVDVCYNNYAVSFMFKEQFNGNDIYTIYGIGQQFAGNLGNGNTSSSDKLSLTPASRNVPSSDFKFVPIKSRNNRGFVFICENIIYSSGYNLYGQIGNNSTSNSALYSQAIMPSGVSLTPNSMCDANDHSLVILVNDKLYFSGLPPMGSGTNTKVLTQFALPV